MPFNILLLPLLGGYIFVSYWNRTRFYTIRHSGERLILNSAVAGFLFLALVFSAGTAAEKLLPDVVADWREVVPFQYSGVSVLAMALGATVWVPLNRWQHRREPEAQKTIQAWNDFLEILLSRAMRESKQISVTTRGGKIYIGHVTGNLNPSFERRYISVIPTLSGYRDTNDK